MDGPPDLMHFPNLLLSNPQPLSEQLKQRTDELWCKIIRANCESQFAQAAPELAEFRHATASLVDGMDDDTLSDSFRRTVGFTTYDSYTPLLSRFFEMPCRASDVVDLLAPGLPDFLVESSSTSGSRWKTFPKYNVLPEIRSSDARSWTVPDPFRRRTTARIWNFWCDQMNVEDEDGCPVMTIYRTSGSVLSLRTDLYLNPEKDDERMATFILDHTAPYAAGFVRKWRSFLLIHALFALSSRSLEAVFLVFINTFVDMMRHLDAEFDALVDCIANGTIPDLDGIAGVRQYLEPNMLPDPERAAELRSLGRPSSGPGWCSRAWPNLRSVTTIASGSFASCIPLARWYLGPHTNICTSGYGSSETWIGSPYNPLELNQFKSSSRDVIEFLDINERDSISGLSLPWEVQVGKRYELVLTTRDGLWRYRLADVVEIAGFDPTDGVPIFQFVERRNVAMRFPDFVVGEKELTAAMSSVPWQNMIPSVVDWTATIDDRCVPATIGFFVEIASDQVSDLDLGAPDRLLDELSQVNSGIAWALAHEVFRKPSVRFVRSGTFSDFRQLKLDEGSSNVGQVKVPVVLPKASYVTWFLDRVVCEL